MTFLCQISEMCTMGFNGSSKSWMVFINKSLEGPFRFICGSLSKYQWRREETNVICVGGQRQSLQGGKDRRERWEIRLVVAMG